MIKEVFLRSAYNYDTDEASIASGILCEDESMAVQSSRDECDINVIVKRAGMTGIIPQGFKIPVFENSDGVFDYRASMDAIIAADRSFMLLPAEMRTRFGNDAAAFLDFVSNPDNLEEMQRMGIAEKPDASIVKGDVSNVQDSSKGKIDESSTKAAPDA